MFFPAEPRPSISDRRRNQLSPLEPGGFGHDRDYGDSRGHNSFNLTDIIACEHTPSMQHIGDILASLEAEVERRETELRRLREAIAVLRGLGEGRDAGGVEEARRGGSQPFAGLGIADAARRWLEEQGGGPRKTREIAEALLAGGLTTRSKNWTATVYAVLASAPGLNRTRTGAWELAKRVP